MGFKDWFTKKEVDPEDIDYIGNAEALEEKNDFLGAIAEYTQLIKYIYSDKEPKAYKHITEKIVDCYINLGDYDKVFELWPLQFDPEDYGGKEMYELIKMLEGAQRMDLVTRAYDAGGKKLSLNKIEFLIKQKRIPEANTMISELLANLKETSPGIENLWLTKAKLSLSLRKWEEANRFLNKILDRNSKHEEARRLKEFCLRQLRM